MLAAAAAATVKIVNKASGAIPSYDGRVDGEALGLDDAPAAELLRDEHGVPTCIANTAGDIFTLHGFAVGQDRLWQVHSQRLAASGRLSEIKAAALPFDIFIRQLGFLKLATEDWESLKESSEFAETVVMVERFVRGVNWAASQRRAHGEMFVVTRQKWAPLTPPEVLAMLRLTAFGVTAGFQHPLIRRGLHTIFGDAGGEWSDMADVGDGTVPPVPPTLTPEMDAAFRALSAADLAWAHGPEELPKGQGSNWWGVSGEHTASGKPLFAGDPHLKVVMPQMWYQVGYKGALNATGLAAACFPGLLIGHNGKLAWSVTVANCDVEDVFLERFRADGRYEHKGEWREADVTLESFAVKGAREPTTVRIQRTVHGPVLEDTLFRLQAFGELVRGEEAAAAAARGHGGGGGGGGGASGLTYKLAYAGLPTRPKSTAIASLRDVLDAADFSSFDAALARASSGISLNFGVASADGHIGYVLCGAVPLGRGKRGSNSCGGDEWLPLCGWTGEQDYTGWLEHPDLPKAFDPPAGLVVSANHRVVDYTTFPHYLGCVFKTGYRARRIQDRLEALLASGAKLGVADMKRLQNDFTSVAAKDFADAVAAADVQKSGLAGDEAALAASALAQLRGWDGSLDAESETASLYQLMHAGLVVRLLRAGVAARRDAVPAALLHGDFQLQPSTVLESLLGGVGHDGLFKIVNELDGHTHRNVLRMLRAPASSWWVAQAGGFDAVVCAAAAGAARELAEKPDRAWGALHATHLAHPLTLNLGFRPGTFLDPAPLLRTGGDTNTPAQVKPKSFHDLTASSTHVSARFVCDCADLAHGSYIITPLGNCEVAGSPFLGNHAHAWNGGEYRKLRWDLDEIRAHAQFRMTFS